MLFAVGACAPDPERLRAQRTIEAEYDRETGRLELITFDSDDNGTVDTWSYMEGKKVLRIEIDREKTGPSSITERTRRWRRSGSIALRIAPVPSVQARHPPAERLDVAPDLGPLFPAFLAVVVAV